APVSFARSALAHVALLSALVVVGGLPLVASLDAGTEEFLLAVRRDAYTPAEAAQLVQGYYEEITVPRVHAGVLLATLEGIQPPDPGVHYHDVSRPTDDFLERELIPGWAGEVSGQRLTINQLGMRDRPDVT